MKDVWIFDLDGTLADVSIRRKKLKEDIDKGISKNIALSYFNTAESNKDDLPNLIVIEVYKALEEQGKHLVIVSGRNESQREVSIFNLSKWGIYNPELYLRELDNYRPDAVYKEEIYNKLISKGYNIVAAVDDQKSIVDLWRSKGILTFDVAGFTRIV